jgi:hypothetical protein
VTLWDGEGVVEAKNKDLKREIKEDRRKKSAEPMWFYDEPEELWRTFREEARGIEREHLEIRVGLRDAELALRTKPEDEYLKARVKYLRKRLEELEKQAPWISAEVPIEVLLWGVPHG